MMSPAFPTSSSDQTPELRQHILDNCAKEFSESYSNYLQYPSLHEKYQGQVDEAVESILTRLDEFGTLVDTVKQVRTSASQDLLKTLVRQSLQLQECFAKIDQLEVQVAKYREQVNTLEEQVKASEKKYGTGIFNLFP